MVLEKASRDNGKDGKTVQVAAVEEDEFTQSGHVARKYLGTAIDQRDMRTLGKRQVLRVRAIAHYITQRIIL